MHEKSPGDWDEDNVRVNKRNQGLNRGGHVSVQVTKMDLGAQDKIGPNGLGSNHS